MSNGNGEEEWRCKVVGRKPGTCEVLVLDVPGTMTGTRDDVLAELASKVCLGLVIDAGVNARDLVERHLYVAQDVTP